MVLKVVLVDDVLDATAILTDMGIDLVLHTEERVL
jgi:hypothetical protein